MVERDSVSYRDSTPFDQSKLQDVQTIKDAILHKQFGEDVRGALSQLPDALVKLFQESGTDQSAEVKEARGKFETLGVHETAQDGQIEKNTTLAENADRQSMNAVSMAQSAASGGPKETFTNKAGLEEKYPNGANGIYLTQDNGHWWYFSGVWHDGGTYQAAGIADNTVTSGKLSNELKYNGLNTAGGKVSLAWQNGYIASAAKHNFDGTPEGTIIDSSTGDFSYSQPVLVQKNDIIVVYATNGGYESMLSMWSNTGDYVSSLFDGIGADIRLVFKIPLTGYILVGNKNADLDNSKVELYRYPKLFSQSLPDNLVGSTDWQDLDLNFETRTYYGSDQHPNNPNKFIQNATTDAVNQLSEPFFVSKGTTVTANAGCSRYNWAISEFQSDGKTPIKGLIAGDSVSGDTSASFKSYYFDHDAYVRIGNNSNIVKNVIVRTSRINNSNGNNSNLTGKVLNVIGDSYVSNNSRPIEETWHYKIALKNNMKYNAYGINGNGLVTPNKTGTPVSERTNQMSLDADYIVIVGGRNDYNDQYPITDFTAGIDKIIKDVVSRYTTAKVCFFTPWSIGDTDTKEIKQIEYVQAIENECNKFGIACFNSYQKAGMSVWDADFRNKYCQSDNDVSHLNADGHDRFMPRAEQFINGL